MEGVGDEIRDSVTGKGKRAIGAVRAIEGGFFTGMSYDPHLSHLMNKKLADLIKRHSHQLLLSFWM